MRRGTNFTNRKPHGNLKYDAERLRQWRTLVSAGKSYAEISRIDELHPHPKLICRKLGEELNISR